MALFATTCAAVTVHLVTSRHVRSLAGFAAPGCHPTTEPGGHTHWTEAAGSETWKPKHPHSQYNVLTNNNSHSYEFNHEVAFRHKDNLVSTYSLLLHQSLDCVSSGVRCTRESNPNWPQGKKHPVSTVTFSPLIFEKGYCLY